MKRLICWLLWHDCQDFHFVDRRVERREGAYLQFTTTVRQFGMLGACRRCKEEIFEGEESRVDFEVV